MLGFNTLSRVIALTVTFLIVSQRGTYVTKVYLENPLKCVLYKYFLIFQSTNSVFQYSLAGDSSRFSVNSLSGQLTVNSVLDYESQSTIIFTVCNKKFIPIILLVNTMGFIQ